MILIVVCYSILHLKVFHTVRKPERKRAGQS